MKDDADVGITGHRKLDRQIIIWKLVLEGYTAIIVTVILVFWLTKGR